MSEKETYTKEMNQKIDEWNNQIDNMNKEAESMEEYERRI
jgi:hypothetical protein